MSLPPCGLYKTTVPIAQIPENRLVYFHNHGTPGPGLYLPAGWTLNRARFRDQGTTLTEESAASTLLPLMAEGLYRVVESFECCEKRCRTFEAERLVQLGYNGQADLILFEPKLTAEGMVFPQMGVKIDPDRASRLARLSIATEAPAAQPSTPMQHLH